MRADPRIDPTRFSGTRWDGVVAIPFLGVPARVDCEQADDAVPPLNAEVADYPC